MRDPIDDLRSEGQRGGPRPRDAFADELERTLRSQHAMGRPAGDAMAGRDWRRPAIGWAVAAIVAAAGFVALRGTVGGQRVDTATSVTVSTSADATDTDATDSTSPDANSDVSTSESPTTTSPDPPGATTSGDEQSTTTTDDTTASASQDSSTTEDTTPPATDTTTPGSTRPTTTAAPATGTSDTSPSSTAPAGTSITLTVDTRGTNDRLTWTVDGPTDLIAGFEIEWIQGEVGGSAGLVRDSAARTVTIDRPVDGAVGYRVIARNASGAAVAQSEVVRAG